MGGREEEGRERGGGEGGEGGEKDGMKGGREGGRRREGRRKEGKETGGREGGKKKERGREERKVEKGRKETKSGAEKQPEPLQRLAERALHAPGPSARENDPLALNASLLFHGYHLPSDVRCSSKDSRLPSRLRQPTG
ncbi:hypothetical protein L345_18411, partial [Ophiophagus hannah]